jgi:transposase
MGWPRWSLLRVAGLGAVLISRGRIVATIGEARVGADVAKLRNAVAIADTDREGEIRYMGEVDALPESGSG